LVVFLSGAVSGQTNVDRLHELAEQFGIEWNAKLQRVADYATEYNVPVRQDLPDGRTIQLIDVQDGVPVTPSPWPPQFNAGDNLRFFINNTNPAPTAAGLGSTQINVTTASTANDAVYNIVPFGTMTVLAENSTNYGRSSTGYNLNSLQNETMVFVGGAFKTYRLISFTLPYQKQTPYAPTIAVQESQVRVGSTTATKTTLNITVTPNTGTGTSMREVGGGSPSNYALQIVRQGDTSSITTVDNTAGGTASITGPSLINQNSGTFVIDGSYLSSGDTYTITAWNRNWFTASDAGANKATQSWTLLGGGIFGGPMTEVWTFEAPSGLAHVNTMAVPFDFSKQIEDDTGTVITLSTVEDLIIAINAQTVAGNVGVFGWYDEVTQKHVGLTSIAYSGTTVDTTLSVATGNTTANIVSTALEKNRPYQVTVMQAGDLELTGTK